MPVCPNYCLVAALISDSPNAELFPELPLPPAAPKARAARSPKVTPAKAPVPLPQVTPDSAPISAPPDAANSYTPCATPGGRPPHAWLADGRSLYDSFNFEWTLLALGDAPPNAQAFEQSALAIGLDLKVVSHPGPDLLALYEAPLVLIRPDQIVAWRGHEATHAHAILAQALGQAMGQGATVHGQSTDPHTPS